MPFRDNAPPPLLHIISAGPPATADHIVMTTKVGVAASERRLAAGVPAASPRIAQPSPALLMRALPMAAALNVARRSRSPPCQLHPARSGRDGTPTALCGKDLLRRGPWASSRASDRCPSSPR